MKTNLKKASYNLFFVLFLTLTLQKQMIYEQIHHIIYNFSYATLFALSWVYFVFLYFALAPVFNGICELLAKKNLLHKIEEKEITQKQLNFEKKHSFKSIFIFGTSTIPIIYLIRHGAIFIAPDTFFNIIFGLVILNLWNEVHFFIIHSIMHLPFFMKRVHYIHHQSKVPTVYSVYSFHWLEALLLSTVPLTILLFFPLSFVAVAIYPLTSVLINYSGHCNYRFGNGKGNKWLLFGSAHNEHHFKNRKNYGFLLVIFDLIFTKFNKTK